MEETTVRYKYLFDEAVETDTINNLIETIYSYQAIDLFISTPGGALVAMDVLVEAINEHPDITVTLCGTVASAGTFLLTDLICPVYIHENLLFLMIHGADMPTEGTYRKYGVDYSILKEDLEQCNLDRANKFKSIGVPKKFIDRYLKGEDVYLYKEDIKKLKLNRK